MLDAGPPGAVPCGNRCRGLRPAAWPPQVVRGPTGRRILPRVAARSHHCAGKRRGSPGGSVRRAAGAAPRSGRAVGAALRRIVGARRRAVPGWPPRGPDDTGRAGVAERGWDRVRRSRGAARCGRRTRSRARRRCAAGRGGAHPLHGLPDVAVQVDEGLHRPLRALADLQLQLAPEVLGEAEQAAAGVVDQRDRAGAEGALADGEGADGVVGDDAARVADDVGVAEFQAERREQVEAGVHAGDHGDLLDRAGVHAAVAEGHRVVAVGRDEAVDDGRCGGVGSGGRRGPVGGHCHTGDVSAIRCSVVRPGSTEHGAVTERISTSRRSGRPVRHGMSDVLRGPAAGARAARRRPGRCRRRAAGTASTCGDPFRRPGGAPERTID